MIATNRIVIATLLCTVLAGCANQSTQVNRAQVARRVTYGEVLQTRAVTINGKESYIGAWGGRDVGRAVGYTYGGEPYIAGAVGGVLGAVAGQALERKVREQPGLEITVQLDDGQVLAIVQDATVAYAAGEKVRVLLGQDGYAAVQRP